MARGVTDVALLLAAPLSALALYALVRPLSQTGALACGIVLMLAIAVARQPAGA